MTEEIINRVANSSLKTIDLEELYPEGERIALDIAPVLYQGMLLREKDFRQWVKEHNWSRYQNTYVAVYCSTDAIIPAWAYMIVAAKLSGIAKNTYLGTLDQLESHLYTLKIEQTDWSEFSGAKVVIKGCSNKPVPHSAYIHLANKLATMANSIMYGEPCSTVPVFKKPK